MARNKIGSEPKKPTLRRRSAPDLYEAIGLIIWSILLIGGLCLLLLAANDAIWMDHQFTMDDNKIPLYVIMILWLIASFALIRFDYVSKGREHENYVYNLKEYEMLRAKWLEQQEAMLQLQTQSIRSQFDYVESDESSVKMETMSDSGIEIIDSKNYSAEDTVVSETTDE